MEGAPREPHDPRGAPPPDPVLPPGGSPAAHAPVASPPPPPPATPRRHPALAHAHLASWWARVAATLIDGLVIFVAFLAIGLPAGLLVYAAAQASVGLAVVVGILAFLLWIVAALAYAPLLMKRPGRRNGQTYGKQALGIRVIRLDGQPSDLGSAALREIAVKGLLVGVANAATAGIGSFLDYLWPLWDDNAQALHDKVVSTAVVRDG